VKTKSPSVVESLESKRLERLLPDWSIPLGAVYWVAPPEGPLPKRVEVLRNYLIEKLAGVWSS
jgi:hypothetical protein